MSPASGDVLALILGASLPVVLEPLEVGTYGGRGYCSRLAAFEGIPSAGTVDEGTDLNRFFDGV